MLWFSNIVSIISLLARMEKQLKCALLLSLKEMALRRVAAVLWSGSDVLAFISKFRYQRYNIKESEKEWQENIEDKIKDKVLKLELPELLKKQMIDIARPIGLQIIKWRESQENHLSNKIQEIILPASAKLCWTTAGRIDYRKTAEELVCCEALDVLQRYQIACINCLEDCIPLLWEELPEEKKNYLYNKVMNKYCSSPCLPSCWPRILKGKLSELDCFFRSFYRNLTSFNQYAFEHSARRGNKLAAECFFQKLTYEEREACLMRTALAVLGNTLSTQTINPFRFKLEERSDVFFYLLSVMTPEQQMEIFKARPIIILGCFLYWPRRDLFLDNAGLFWTILTPNQYDCLLQFMINKFKNSDPYFPKLFPEFFKQSPLVFKTYFVDQESAHSGTPAYRFLSILFKCGDSESIKVIFRNVDAANKVKIVFDRGVIILFKKFIFTDELHMVEVCLREAMLSKEDRKRWKEAFMEFLRLIDGGQIEWENPKLKRLFEFLDETDASADKRMKALKRKHEN